MSSPCLIPSNPDIAGIGVRAAIYAQNLLCFVPAVWAIWDGQVTEYELDSVETQSTTNLVLAFAILISCIVQAFTLGLTNYHASIVLSMSWINNTSVFVYFLMYVYHKASCGPVSERIGLRWSAWFSHLMNKLRAVLHITERTTAEARDQADGEAAHIGHPQQDSAAPHVITAEQARGQSDGEGARTEHAQQGSAETPRVMVEARVQCDEEGALTGNAQEDSAETTEVTAVQEARRILDEEAAHMGNTQQDLSGEKGSTMKTMFRRVALLFGSLHLTLMAALGIWLWSRPQAFGKTDSTCATNFASLAIVGTHVSFRSNALRIFSLAFYSVFLLPGFNLLIPMLVFLSVFICHDKYLRNVDWEVPRRLAGLSYRTWKLSSNLQGTWSPHRFPFRPHRLRQAALWLPCALLWLLQMILTFFRHATASPSSSTFPVWIGLASLLAINIVFIADIELTLHRNRNLQASGEAEWGFGQVLAILLLCMPLRDIVEMVVSRRQKVLATDELRKAIHQNDVVRIHALVKAGADPNARAEENRTALEVVALAGNKDCLRALINAGVNLDAKFTDGRTALEVACTAGHEDCVAALVEAGVNCQAKFTDGRTALEAVALAGWEYCLRTLINAHIDLEAKFSDGRTALEVACTAGHEYCVEALVEAGINCQATFTDGRTALEAVALAGWQYCLRALINAHIDLEAKFSDGRTALEVACTAGHKYCVEALVEAGINCQATFTDGRTALEAIALAGWLSCLRALMNARVNLEAKFQDGRTALEVACTVGQIGCTEELLRAGVNCQVKFTDGRTALEAVVKAGWWTCIYCLRAAGVDLEAQFSDGGTALEVVTVAGDERCLRQLLSDGVNLEAKFSDGRTALEVASSLGHERCVGLLNHVAAGNPASQWEIPRSILLGWRPPQYLP